MLKDILPERLYCAINKINFSLLNEIRLRTNKPIMLNISGKNYYLNDDGIITNLNMAFVCDGELINYIIKKVSSNSFYSINEQIINGFISYKNGIRIGVAGNVVSENGSIRTIKNINSLNIRIPHFVKNCSLNCYPYLTQNLNVCSTLIISPPGAGKTTFLKDFVYQIANHNTNNNILIIDERGEITGENTICLGNMVDVYTNCSKTYGFNNGVRSLNPSVVITDEINLDKDLEIIETALTSGVKVVATIHAKNIEDLKLKNKFSQVLKKQLFERFVVLSSNLGPGTLEGVYNQNLNCIYC